MPFFTANGKKLEADLFVFDKDGLMFSPEPFWIELVNERCRSLLSVCSPEQTVRWARMMGADTESVSEEKMIEAIKIELGEKKMRFLEGNKAALSAGMAVGQA